MELKEFSHKGEAIERRLRRSSSLWDGQLRNAA